MNEGFVSGASSLLSYLRGEVFLETYINFNSKLD